MWFSVLFLGGLCVLAAKIKRLMPSLISLEFLSLVFLGVLAGSLKSFYQDSLVFLVFLVVAASESVLGLVLFVLFSRGWGKDYINLLCISKF